MRRRDFITLVGGAAAGWPLAARAEQPRERMRRIGVLMHLAADDPEGQSRLAAFLQGLQEAGWAVGRNVNIDVRWAAGEPDRYNRYADEIVALVPDVIVTSAELGMSVKSLELLKEISPKVTRVAVLRDAADPTSTGQFGAIKGAAPSFRVEISAIGVSSAEEIERGITAFAREPNGGMIVLAVPTTVIHRHLIIKLAAQHRLPAVYNSRYWAAEGGLVSYGADVLDQYRRTAGYVDRVLRGAKPADLPVQAPTKFELVINLKTARALGLEVPPTLSARADEVIE